MKFRWLVQVAVIEGILSTLWAKNGRIGWLNGMRVWSTQPTGCEMSFRLGLSHVLTFTYFKYIMCESVVIELTIAIMRGAQISSAQISPFSNPLWPCVVLMIVT